jgi:DNA-binding NarL/FixJ family response regulator
MDLRVLVLTSDHDLAELVRAQVENLGGRCTLADAYGEIGTALDWADAAVIDLAGAGLDDLSRLRVEGPKLKVLAIAPDAPLSAAAQHAGVDALLQEPFSIADLIDAVRTVARGDEVVDLRPATMDELDDAPWWATR